MSTSPIDVAKEAVAFSTDTVMYTDGLARASIGPLVSKITFGADVENGKPRRPQFTIVMPSAAVLQLAQQVLGILQADQAQEGLLREIETHKKALQSFAKKSAT